MDFSVKGKPAPYFIRQSSSSAPQQSQSCTLLGFVSAIASFAGFFQYQSQFPSPQTSLYPFITYHFNSIEAAARMRRFIKRKVTKGDNTEHPSNPSEDSSSTVEATALTNWSGTNPNEDRYAGFGRLCNPMELSLYNTDVANTMPEAATYSSTPAPVEVLTSNINTLANKFIKKNQSAAEEFVSNINTLADNLVKNQTEAGEFASNTNPLVDNLVKKNQVDWKFKHDGVSPSERVSPSNFSRPHKSSVNAPPTLRRDEKDNTVPVDVAGMPCSTTIDLSNLGPFPSSRRERHIHSPSLSSAGQFSSPEVATKCLAELVALVSDVSDERSELIDTPREVQTSTAEEPTTSVHEDLRRAGVCGVHAIKPTVAVYMVNIHCREKGWAYIDDPNNRFETSLRDLIPKEDVLLCRSENSKYFLKQPRAFSPYALPSRLIPLEWRMIAEVSE